MSPDEVPILELRGFSYTYLEGTPKANEAIRNVSFAIRRGERVAIVGPTHSGKSTVVDSFALNLDLLAHSDSTRRHVPPSACEDRSTPAAV